LNDFERSQSLLKSGHFRAGLNGNRTVLPRLKSQSLLKSGHFRAPRRTSHRLAADESQSLLKSGHFRGVLTGGNRSDYMFSCRNPFLNQVIFEKVEEAEMKGLPAPSQSLLKSGHFRAFPRRQKDRTAQYCGSQSLLKSGHFREVQHYMIITGFEVWVAIPS